MFLNLHEFRHCNDIQNAKKLLFFYFRKTINKIQKIRTKNENKNFEAKVPQQFLRNVIKIFESQNIRSQNIRITKYSIFPAQTST
jgi:hypothetical protein